MPATTAAWIASRLASGRCPSESSSVPSTSMPISRTMSDKPYCLLQFAGFATVVKKLVEYYRKVMNLDQFAGINAAYVLELYERYRQNPESVDSETRKAFESWTPADASSASAETIPAAGARLHVVVGAANLAESI